MSTLRYRRLAHACATVVTTVFVPMLVPPPSAAHPRCPGSARPPGNASLRTVSKAVVCEINLERRSRGLAAVSGEPRLSRAARRHARSMVRLGFFSHTSPGGGTMSERLRANGYGGGRWAAGETLGWGSGDAATPHGVVSMWMGSPPHRAILLEPGYRDVGIGVALGNPFGGSRRGTATYVGELGRAR